MEQLLATFFGLNVLHLGTWASAIGIRNTLNSDNSTITIEYAPYMAAVYLGNEYKCGASIIDDEFVLTAARCFYENNENAPNMWRILIGSNQLNTGGLFIEVKYVVCHDKYNDATTDNDICLLKLSTPVPFGCIWDVDKVKLPVESRKILEATMVKINGWGYTDNNRELVGNNLRQTTVPIMSNECCERMLHRHLTDQQICAGSLSRDSCTGDVGGPLIYNGVQIGVISYHWSKCDRYPTVFTNVASFLSWIEETMDGWRHY